MPALSIPCTRPLRLFEVADDGARELVGSVDLDVHHRFQQRRLRLFHARAKGRPARHLERQLIGVHFVIAAVVDNGAEIHHGIPGQIAAGSGLLDALLDRGNKLPWNHPAKDVVHKLEAAASRKRFYAELAVAELPMSPGLLLVSSMARGLRPHRLPVGNLW